ncbi:hypothetical protein [Bdellovibrio sp. HCB337]|uniref:hypothetical protein n=1 Tax=Bdellovibrio sp. HCB337 TaxID=3394358 RepID=UPI0039A5FCB0
MVEIKHLSVSVKQPEQAAKALAEMTGGKAERFISRNMPGAWVCIWDEKTNHLIEFLPDGYLMHPTEYGADFKKLDFDMNYNSTHFQLEVKTPLSDIQEVADNYGLAHKFRPTRGGPLYDVWFEKMLLVEFVSDEIRALAKQPAAEL